VSEDHGRPLTVDGRQTALGSDVTITGFTFAYGDATSAKLLPGCGGGVLISHAAPTFANNTIVGNVASSSSVPGKGGGVCLDHSSAVLTDNLIGGVSGGNGNIAATQGQGQGGGIYLNQSPVTLRDNMIIGNYATSSGSGAGGGIWIENSAATLERNRVVKNFVGGAAAASDGNGVLVANSARWLFSSNLVTQNYDPSATATSGSAIYVNNSSGTLLHTTLADHDHASSQVALSVTGSSSVTLTNTIISGQASGTGVSAASSATARLMRTLFYGNLLNTSGGTISNLNEVSSGDPGFLDPFTLNYHIAGAPLPSAARDQGVATSATTDVDGQPRSLGSAPDIGADETFTGFLLADTAPDSVAPGGVFTYTISYTFNDAFSAQNSVLTVTLPISVTNPVPSSGGVIHGNVVTWDLFSLAPNASGSKTVRVTAPKAPNTTLQSAARITSDGGFAAEANTSLVVGRFRVMLPLVRR
jgi:hypothetical protein